MPTIRVPNDSDFVSLPAMAEDLRLRGLLITHVDEDRIDVRLPPSRDVSVFRAEHWLSAGSFTMTRLEDRIVTTNHPPHARILVGSALVGAFSFAALGTTLAGRLWLGIGAAVVLTVIQYRTVRARRYDFIFVAPHRGDHASET